MRWLLLLSRIAFICNVCFLLAFSISITNWVKDQNVEGTIIILGYILVVITNPLVNLCYLVLLIFRKKFWELVPTWLITANVLFFIMQIFFILYLNDKPSA